MWTGIAESVNTSKLTIQLFCPALDGAAQSTTSDSAQRKQETLSQSACPWGKNQKPNTPRSREGIHRARKGVCRHLNGRKKKPRCMIKHRRLVALGHWESYGKCPLIYTEKHLKCWHTCTTVSMKFDESVSLFFQSGFHLSFLFIGTQLSGDNGRVPHFKNCSWLRKILRGKKGRQISNMW